MTRSNKKITLENGHVRTTSAKSVKMNWIIYNLIIQEYKGQNFRLVRLRLAFFLLAVTHAQISEILLLKIENLRSLEEQYIIKVKNRTLFIPDQKTREIIRDRKEDINYLCKMKTPGDYIFTKDIDSETPLRRETLTRVVNDALKSVGSIMHPPRTLSSRNFQRWDEED